MVLTSNHYAVVYQVLAVFVVRLPITQGVINLCQKVYPPVNIGRENCSLACSPKFLNFEPSDEVFALCKESKSESFFPCKSNDDCRLYHIRAKCQKIPCLCEGGELFGNQTVYVLDPKIPIPNIELCTVSHKGFDAEAPIVLPPFPWKTLVVVFGIVASCAACLITVKWLSPYIRRMQAKSAARNHQNRRSDHDSTTLFHGTSSSERTFIRPCGSPSSRRAFEPSTSTNGDGNSDKPPPYELAIQDPPAYDEVEDEPLNPNAENSDLEPTFLPSPRPFSVATV